MTLEVSGVGKDSHVFIRQKRHPRTETKQCPTRSPLIRVYPVEDGLHLKDSMLSLDVYGKANLSFVSSAKVAIKKLDAQRIIATEETVKIIEALRKKKLTP